ncbi:MAG: metalloregulator ArsR/SmtB family transcription factor [Myxococcota bacterium]|nr:metalloregulator ArsR/SmtB family transcription factor [Myxococcota bacterium]
MANPDSTAGEELQRVFKTLADPTRVRILGLLEREELVVQELMEVLGMAQSRVSRHLAILRDAGLLVDRRDGTYVSYRFAPLASGPWRDTWKLVRKNLENDPTTQRDLSALAQTLEERGDRSRAFFDSVGPEWDALRKVFHDDVLRARAVTRMVSPGQSAADIGTGTGILAAELARLGVRVIGVDNSSRMLDAARAKLDAEGITSVELRRGEVQNLPIEDEEVDAAFAHMVLHYLASPGEALREMARIVRPGGVVVVADFLQHENEWMRQELRVVWLGFAETTIREWFEEAGLTHVQINVEASTPRGKDLPDTFIAAGRKS